LTGIDILLQPDRAFFLRGDRFTCQGRFIDPQVDRLEQAKIGRDVVSGLQNDQVAGHQLMGWNGPAIAIPDHVCLRGGHLFERR
jgi:hypothetical protein